MSQPVEVDVVIVGGGLAGLAAARRLDRAGVTWRLLEAADRIQLVLPFDRPREAALDAAVDLVRDRFGSPAVTRAVLLNRDPGVEMPLLPD